MLHIQKYIKEHGLDKFIIQYVKTNRIKLKSYETENLLFFKYDQLESKYDEIEQECRGLILDATTFEVVLLPFKKFFNYGEHRTHPINLDNARYFKKEDGSLISLYYHNNEWRTSTTGTAFGEGNINIDVVNYPYISTFNGLFWKTLEFMDIDIELFKSTLDSNKFYMFELTTPLNTIVVPQKTFRVSLLAVRDKLSLKEISIESKEIQNQMKLCKIPIVEQYSFVSLLEAKNVIDGWDWTEEGLIILDPLTFHRAKVKNLDYVAIHHAKSQDAVWRLMSIVITNEFDEFFCYFPEKKELLLDLAKRYDKLIEKATDFEFTIFKSEMFENFKEDYVILIKAGFKHEQAVSKAKAHIAKFIGLSLPKELGLLKNFYFKKLGNHNLTLKEYVVEHFNSQEEANMRKLYESLSKF